MKCLANLFNSWQEINKLDLNTEFQLDRYILFIYLLNNSKQNSCRYGFFMNNSAFVCYIFRNFAIYDLSLAKRTKNEEQ